MACVEMEPPQIPAEPWTGIRRVVGLGDPARRDRIARSVTHLFNPLAMAVVSAALVTANVIDIDGLIWWFPTMVVVTSLPPLLYVLYLVRTGYLRDFYMPDRSRRTKPLIATIVWILVSALLLGVTGAPKIIITVMISALVYTVVLSALTLRSKVSFHCATVATAAATALLLANPVSWILCALVPLVAWARITLRRHTPAEAVLGIVAGWVLTRVTFWLTSTWPAF